MVEVLNGGMDGGVEMLDITEGALGGYDGTWVTA
jgi:hypothetical protein